MKFYEKLGWQTEGVVGADFEHGPLVMFNPKGSLMLALYPRKDLAWDARASLGERSATEFSIGHLANSREAVDEVMRQSASTG